MKSPFISVITCTRNSEKYLPTCLASIKSQDFQDFEHIVIDGLSADKTLALVPSSSQVFQVNPNGISDAMNEGIKHASGQYLYFLHSDDAFHDPQVLSRVADYLKTHKELDWGYGQIQVVDADDKKIGIFPKYKIFQMASPTLLKFFNFIPHQATFVKKAVFEKFGNFDTSLKTCMDYDFWLKICKVTLWGYLPVLISNYRVHQHSQSSATINKTLNKVERLRVQKKNTNFFESIIATLVNMMQEIFNQSDLGK
jgi:glycosyltransferase involved in cell wall biosynthesis